MVGSNDAAEGRFGGQVGVVAGGASGSGRAAAVRLGAEGAVVAVLHLDAEGAPGPAQALQAGGARGLALGVDAADVFVHVVGRCPVRHPGPPARGRRGAW